MALQVAQGQNIQSSSDTQGGPNTVLRVIVEHMIYPISLDILYQVMQINNVDNPYIYIILFHIINEINLESK